MKRCISLLLIFVTFSHGLAQQSNFSKQDTLRGSITPERIWWDLLHYNLDFKVFPSTKSIEGSNLIRYEVLSENLNLSDDFMKKYDQLREKSFSNYQNHQFVDLGEL